jgi:hypothetical protein
MKTNTMLLSRSQPLYEMLDQVWAPKAKSKSFLEYVGELSYTRIIVKRS